jgi:cytochrome c oxidase accessory protein FixG
VSAEQVHAGPARVLPTLELDGRRRWLRPTPSRGRFADWRRRVGLSLVALFLLLPHLRVAGKPALLLDIVARRFTILGATFTPTETPVLMAFLLTVFLGIFLVTALFGRVWCGWGCPQSVWLELVFRPLERLIEGGPQRQRLLDAEGPDGRRALKLVVFLGLSFVLGNTFLSYFVGTDALFTWMRSSPVRHPTAFVVMAVTTGLVFFDFAFFREQTCLVACPYGRFQSALLDRQSLVVGYDRARGEPRGKVKKGPAAAPSAPAAPAPRGDCVDCSACVATCPTGIDIRDGLQMECIGCAQCIDACDAIMDRLGRPRGLVRYDSQAGLAGEPGRVLRPRVFIYGGLLLGLGCALLGLLGTRRPAEVTLLRTLGVPYIERGQDVEVHARVKVLNRTDGPRTYRVELGPSAPGVALARPVPPLPLAPDASGVAEVALLAPRAAFVGGRAAASLVVAEDTGFTTTVEVSLVGPQGRHP